MVVGGDWGLVASLCCPRLCSVSEKTERRMSGERRRGSEWKTCFRHLVLLAGGGL